MKVWDLMVLEWGPNGLVMAYFLWRDTSVTCEGVFLSWALTSVVSLGFVAWYLACVTLLWSWGHLVGGIGMSVPLPLVGDSICRLDESASISAGCHETSVPSVDSLPSVSSVVLHSLSLGKGMDRLLQILTCGLPCRQLKTVSL